MAGSDIGHGTDTDEARGEAGGAQPTGEPRSQDTAGGGRGLGLSVTTIIGAVLIAVPVIWAIAFLSQAGASGAGSGFVVVVAIVLLFCIGVGVVLLRGLIRT